MELELEAGKRTTGMAIGTELAPVRRTDLRLDFHPFSSLLNAPITIFNFKIEASIVPEMEEDLEILTFKRA